MENEIKIGDKYFIEVEVIDPRNGQELLVGIDKIGLFVAKKSELIPHSKLMEVPVIGKEYEFSDSGEEWKKRIFTGYGTNTFEFYHIRPIKKTTELEEAIKICEKYGLKIER